MRKYTPLEDRPDLLSEKRLLVHIKQELKQYNDNRAAACLAWGISEGYLCDVLKGRKPPADTLSKAMGYRRKVFVCYEKIKEPVS